MTTKDLYSLDRDPTFDQLKNAFNGHIKQENQRFKAIRNVIFYCSRYNALRTAFSKEQQKAIQRDRPPWEQPQRKEKMSRQEINNTIAGMG